MRNIIQPCPWFGAVYVCRQPCTLAETSDVSLLSYHHFAHSPIFSGPLHSSLESSTGSRPSCRITERRQRAWYQLFVLFHGTSTSLFNSRFILVSSRRISTSEPGVNSSVENSRYWRHWKVADSCIQMTKECAVMEKA